VDQLGAVVAREAESLLWLRGSRLDDETDRVDVVILLVDPVSKPKMHFGARCCLLGHDGAVEFHMPDEWPVVVSISSRASRLSPNFRAVDMVTSDELSLDLVSSNRVWQLIPLTWNFADTDSLLDMVITGAGEPFKKVIKLPRPRAAKVDLANELGISDPIAYGREHVDTPSSSAPAAGEEEADDPLGGPLDDAGDEVLDGIGAHAEFENVVGLPEAALDDMREEMEHVMQVVDHAADDFGLGDVRADLAPDEALGDSDLEEERGVASGSLDPPPVEGLVSVLTPAPENTFADLIRTSHKDSLGYTSNPLPPFNSIPKCGRINTWPNDRLEKFRSVGCRCYLHPSCSAPAKARWQTPDELLLKWLYSGVVVDGASRARKKELGREHMRLFASIFAAHQDDAAASGAAGSSTDAAPS